jgi:Chitin binding Peritrophin-A domain
MRIVLAVVLLAAVAGVIDGQTSRATRSPQPQPPRTLPTRPGGPVRQQGPVRVTTARPNGTTRPTQRPVGPTRPTQGPVGPTRQTQGPVGPTRPSQGPVGPTRPSQGPVGPTRPTQETNRPVTQTQTMTNLWPTIRPIFPDINDRPTVPTLSPLPGPNPIPNPPNGQSTTRPPRIGLTGIPDNRCPANQNPRNPVLLSHQSNCERFYKCDHGLAFEFQCPAGQHFNAMRSLCDFPVRNSFCDGSSAMEE